MKQRQSMVPTKVNTPSYVKEPETVVENKVAENNTIMTTSEKIELANEVLGTKKSVRRIKSDKGLIERAESAATILTEDNKELLID